MRTLVLLFTALVLLTAGPAALAQGPAAPPEADAARVTLNAVDQPLGDVLAALSSQIGRPVILRNGANVKVRVSGQEIPFSTAMRVLARGYRLVAAWNDGKLYVAMPQADQQRLRATPTPEVIQAFGEVYGPLLAAGPGPYLPEAERKDLIAALEATVRAVVQQSTGVEPSERLLDSLAQSRENRLTRVVVGPVLRARLDLAAREPPDKALRTLDEATRLAEQFSDTVGRQAVANRAQALGIRSYERRDLATAQAFLQRALATNEKVAADSRDVAANLTHLGNIVRDRGNLVDAEQFYRRALRIYDKLAPNSLTVASSLNALGLVAREQGRLNVAKESFRRALAIQERVAPVSLEVAASLSSLAAVEDEGGNSAVAIALLRRALKITDRVAPNSSLASGVLRHLARLLLASGASAEAAAYLKRADEKVVLSPADSSKRSSRRPVATLILIGGDTTIRRSPRGPLLTPVVRGMMLQGGYVIETGSNGGAELLFRDGSRVNLGAGTILEIPRSASDRMSIRKGTVRVRVPTRSRHRTIIDGPAASAHIRGTELILTVAKDGTSRLEVVKGKVQFAGARGSVTVRAGQQRVARPSGKIRPAAGLPQVRFLSPAENSEVQGDEVSISALLLAPLPLATYWVWINGRPLGKAQGFSVTDPGEKGRILEKGDKWPVIAAELPAQVAALMKQRQYLHSRLLQRSIPVEDTDGVLLEITLVAETIDGSISAPRVVRVRRPEAEANRGPLRILAIGIGAYSHLPRLAFAAADAQDLAAALQVQAGGGKLYRSATVKVLIEGEATLPAIRQALGEFTRDVQPGETLMLILSGHGLKEGETFYFAPVGLDPTQIPETGLPWKEVLAQLRSARQKARAVWVLADCCRAAPDLGRERQATGRDLRRGAEEGGNLVICTASAGDRPSYESEEFKHGLFTQAWLDALRGEAPSIAYLETTQGRLLTLSRLQFILDDRVTHYARRAGRRQQVEFPLLEGSFLPSQQIFVAPRPQRR